VAKKNKQRTQRQNSERTPQHNQTILHQVFVSLKQGQYDRALQRLEQLMQRTLSPTEQAAAQRLKAEARLQNALVTANLDSRLHQIRAAQQDMPDSPRLGFYAGLTLWQMKRPKEALHAWEEAAAQRPNWSGIGYLCQLARLVMGEAWSDAGLSPAEANTLRLTATMMQGRASDIAQAGQAPGGFLGDAPALWQTLITLMQPRQASPPPLFTRSSDRIVTAIADYYAGVVAMRAGDAPAAHTAWKRVANSEWRPPWLQQNLTASHRQQMIALAEEGRWDKIVDLSESLDAGQWEDTILAETVALAHDHLGFAEAKAQRWATAAKHWTRANTLAGNRRLAQNLALASETAGRWQEAATAWREMVRRRPRKADHPDYLDDAQVAAIWYHTALCYREDGDIEQAITCLKHASNYAGNDTDIRFALAQALVGNEQITAAENEVERILQIDPNHLEALLLRGHLFSDRWDRDDKPTWRQILKLQPDHAEAKEALARSYLNDVEMRFFVSWQIVIEHLEKGLTEVPEHPFLHLELANAYAKDEQRELAITRYLQAYQLNPNHAPMGAKVLLRLINLKADDKALELLPRVRQIRGLLPGFWVNLIDDVTEYKLGWEWVDRFTTEGVELANQSHGTQTPAWVLVHVCRALIRAEAFDQLQIYRERLQAQAATSGALELIEATLAAAQADAGQPPAPQIQRLLATAKRLARRARDTSLLELIDEEIDKINRARAPMPHSPHLPPELIRILMENFPDRPPSPYELKRFLDDIGFDLN